MPSKSSAPSVFVRGLSYELSDEALGAHFSDTAPVKRAFVVRDRATHTSRGFGFVQFALEEDAQAAVLALNNGMLAGRKLQVGLASEEAAAAAGGKGGKRPPPPPRASTSASDSRATPPGVARSRVSVFPRSTSAQGACE